MIRATISSDGTALLNIVKESGEFDADGLTLVQERLTDYLVGNSDELWFTADDGEPVGVAYCAPEPMADGTWNLLMLWLRPDRHGQGHGVALVRHVEEKLVEQGMRLLLVETSGVDDYARARAFYEKCDFIEEARIRDFYQTGDDKIVYWKSLI